jgi:hypothetical protein
MLVKASEALHESLETLYSVFSVYPFRPNMPCCVPHCFSEEEIQVLDKPLHLLTERDLSAFTWSLLLTCGETEDFKHFLPRLFELSVTSQDYFCDTEIVVGKLGRADFSTWSTHERATVLEFLQAWWLSVISAPPEHHKPSSSDLLTGLCCANLGVKPFLDGWLELSSRPAVLHLADFVVDNGAKVSMDKTFNAFLEAEHVKSIKDWLFSKKVLAHLETMFFTHADRRASEQISFAVSILESLQAFVLSRKS